MGISFCCRVPGGPHTSEDPACCLHSDSVPSCTHAAEGHATYAVDAIWKAPRSCFTVWPLQSQPSQPPVPVPATSRSPASIAATAVLLALLMAIVMNEDLCSSFFIGRPRAGRWIGCYFFSAIRTAQTPGLGLAEQTPLPGDEWWYLLKVKPAGEPWLRLGGRGRLPGGSRGQTQQKAALQSPIYFSKMAGPLLAHNHRSGQIGLEWGTWAPACWLLLVWRALEDNVRLCDHAPVSIWG
ncbi:hypothetical protein L3Q82_026518 [Scortum barcoo]|uniref:Uncharacterized protein n=1 Tax=Scortum barcoo TaxID=214431 RepID=A0ACB8WJP0_9TELE|nr:hypothetical protein L3Q82_026518 [Scortum barcoo]